MLEKGVFIHVIVTSLQTVPLQSIMHELDKCLHVYSVKALPGGVYNMLLRVGCYIREI